jgi:signal transduction histidine kinase
VLIATWVLFSAGGDLGLWLRGSSLLLTGVAAALLPFLGRRASKLDRRSFHPRIALALVTATTVPLLIAMTAMVASDSTAITVASRQLAFTVTIMTSLGCVVGGAWMASRLAGPIALVVRGTDRIAAGERKVDLVHDNSTTEIVQLAHSVQEMATSLDARAAQQADLAQAAAVYEERQRISRDLHDSVAQTLTAIKMAAHSALSNWQGRPEVAHSRIELAGSLAGRAQAEMRALIFEVRPDQLAVDGLVQALVLQAAALAARHEFAVETSFCTEPNLPLLVKEAFYRIGQEALNNAVQHARPTRLALTLTSVPCVVLALHDDGPGFNPHGSYPGHLGLRSMRERADRIGAGLTIESGPAGTLIRLSYPANGQ